MSDREPHTVGIDELEIGVRGRNTLAFQNLDTLADILLFGRNRLGRIPNCGAVTIEEIDRAVRRFGYRF